MQRHDNINQHTWPQSRRSAESYENGCKFDYQCASHAVTCAFFLMSVSMEGCSSDMRDSSAALRRESSCMRLTVGHRHRTSHPLRIYLAAICRLGSNNRCARRAGIVYECVVPTRYLLPLPSYPFTLQLCTAEQAHHSQIAYAAVTGHIFPPHACSILLRWRSRVYRNPVVVPTLEPT